MSGLSYLVRADEASPAQSPERECDRRGHRRAEEHARARRAQPLSHQGVERRPCEARGLEEPAFGRPALQPRDQLGRPRADVEAAEGRFPHPRVVQPGAEARDGGLRGGDAGRRGDCRMAARDRRQSADDGRRHHRRFAQRHVDHRQRARRAHEAAAAEGSSACSTRRSARSGSSSWRRCGRSSASISATRCSATTRCRCSRR